MTDQELKDLVAQNAIAIAEFRLDMKKSREEFDRRMKERDERFDRKTEKFREDFDHEIKKSREEFKLEMKERDERFEREMRKLNEDWDKRLRATVKLRNKLWLIQWDIAEDSIRRSVERNLSQYNIDIHNIVLNKEIKDEETQRPLWEYDIIAVNDKEVVVVEVKNKVTQEHLNHFLKVQLPRFKELLPEYKNYKLLWGMWWLVIKPEMEKLIESKWLFAFTQNWDSFKIHNKKGFVPKVYW